MRVELPMEFLPQALRILQDLGLDGNRPKMKAYNQPVSFRVFEDSHLFQFGQGELSFSRLFVRSRAPLPGFGVPDWRGSSSYHLQTGTKIPRIRQRMANVG